MPRKSDPAYKTESSIFATRLREIMRERGENQTTLADKITAQYVTIQRQTISLYMNGQSKPDTERLTAIAKVLDVSADWLLGLSETKSTSADVQNICKQTGLSEGIVNVLLNNQRDSFGGFAPIKPFNRFFSPIDFHCFLVALCAYFVDVDAIKGIQHDAEIELTQMKEACNIETAETFEDQMSLCCDKWRNEILAQQKEYRYRRFETIDFFTKLLDSVEEGECVQQSISNTEKMCTEFENVEFGFDE